MGSNDRKVLLRKTLPGQNICLVIGAALTLTLTSCCWAAWTYDETSSEVTVATTFEPAGAISMGGTNPVNRAYWLRSAYPGHFKFSSGQNCVDLRLTNMTVFAECVIGRHYQVKGSSGPANADAFISICGQASWFSPRGATSISTVEHSARLAGHLASIQQADMNDPETKAAGVVLVAASGAEGGLVYASGSSTNVAASTFVRNGGWANVINERSDTKNVTGPCASGEFASYWSPLSIDVLNFQAAFSVKYSGTYKVSEGMPFLTLPVRAAMGVSADVKGTGDAESSCEADLSGSMRVFIQENLRGTPTALSELPALQ